MPHHVPPYQAPYITSAMPYAIPSAPPNHLGHQHQMPRQPGDLSLGLGMGRGNAPGALQQPSQHHLHSQMVTQPFTQQAGGDSQLGGGASQPYPYGSGYNFADLGTQASFHLPDDFTQNSLNSQSLYDGQLSQHLFDGQLSQPNTQPGSGLDYSGLYDASGAASQEFTSSFQVRLDPTWPPFHNSSKQPVVPHIPQVSHCTAPCCMFTPIHHLPVCPMHPVAMIAVGYAP